MPINHNTATQDRLAYEARSRGLTWIQVAAEIGVLYESTARTAANRHAARLGLTVPGSTSRAPRQPRVRTRKFGVEIEFVDTGARTATLQAVARAVAKAVYTDRGRTAPCSAYGIHVAGYHGNTCSGCRARITTKYWKVERDGSVSDHNGGGECVSPILTGEDGLEEVTIAMRAIRSVGGQVDTRCGMHIHLSVDGMSSDQRATVIETLYRHHDLMDRLVAPSRRNNHYCHKPHAAEVARWADAMRRSGTYGHGEKYRTINVAAYPRYGTVEVRYHQGTLNGRKAGAWIRFLLAMFDTVANDEQTSIAPGLAALGSLADLGRLRQQDAAYLTQRAEALATR
jgi:hypothetical protein